MKKKTHKRMRKIFSVLTIIFFLVSFISPLAPFTNFASASSSGSIWTTLGDCGSISQDVNHYAINDSVYINGSNFSATTTYDWDITKTPTDSNSPVASGDYVTDENGDFCFLAHTILDGESGEYKVNFGGKNDNYRVNSSTCTDEDDDGYFEEEDCDGDLDCDDDEYSRDNICAGECDLKITKTAREDNVYPGDELIYYLTLTNIGDANCTGGGVQLTDEFDKNTTVISSDPHFSGENSDHVTWNFGTMEPGDTETVELVVGVSEDAVCNSTIKNEAYYWSNQTGTSKPIGIETDVVCDDTPYCGDGITQWPNEAGVYETCDEGANNGQPGSTCDYDCTLISTQTCKEGDVVPNDGPIQEVNIGSTSSEFAYNLSGWSDEWVKPGWGGNYGGGSSDGSLRLLTGQGDGCDSGYEFASMVFDAGDYYADSITFNHLDGSQDDSFNIYVNDVLIGHYVGQGGSETWVESTFSFPPVSGEFTVKLEVTSPNDDWCDSWGQVAFSSASIEGYNCEIKTPDCVDLDGDGYGLGNDCLGKDCDDTNPALTTDCSDVCQIGEVTLLNSSFETPIFDIKKGWNIFDSSQISWGVDWVVPGDETPMLELQNAVKTTWVASDGRNYAELDADGRGDKKASVIINQSVSTFVGAEYKLSFDFAARPGTGDDNVLKVYIDNSLVSTFTADGGANSSTSTSWANLDLVFQATGTTTNISFADGGTPNTLGTFIDNITLELSDCNTSYCGDGIVDKGEECDSNSDLCSDDCKIEYCGDGIVNQEWEECDGEDVEDGFTCNKMCQVVEDTTCSDLVLARVNVDEVNNFEDDDSNMTSNIYLGSDWYHVPAGTWFPLYSNGTYFSDPDIASYEDVPGLAVQRLKNDVRAVMYGSHSSKDKEHIHGNIEFYNASVLDQRSDNSNDKPKNNRLEPKWNGTGEPGWKDGSGIDHYNAGDDEVWFEDGNDSQSFFWLTTTTADDGYYTGWEIQNKCQESICGYKYNSETEKTIPDWTVYLKEKQSCNPGDEWADEVVSYENNNTVSDPDRTHPERALGPAQDDDTYNFVSLGLGGTLILSFDNTIWNGEGDDVMVYETTFNNSSCSKYPEKINVYASQTGNDGDWVFIGGPDCQEGESLFDLGELAWAKYIKIVDDTDMPGGDGYDVDGVKALHCYNWNTVESTLTNGNGRYCFYNLEDGDYRIEEDISETAWTYDGYYYKDISYPSCVDLNQYSIATYDATSSQEICSIDFYNHLNSYCGDNNIDEGEQCDDGNNINGDGCSESCQVETSPFETCVYIDEDGLASTTDDRSLASSSIWGFLLENSLASSTVETTDGCFAINLDPETYHLEGRQATTWVPLVPAADYYDFVATYGNSNNFEFVYYYNDPRVDEWCGDNIVNGEEECDDGNNINGDGCNEYCVNEVKKSSGGGGGGLINYCGDGRVQALNSYGQKEECDGLDGLGEGETCTNICTIVSPEKVIVLGEAGAPFLTISIDPQFSSANAGDKNVKFSITVKNEGEIDSVNTELNVSLPDGFTYNDPAVSGVWALGDIAPGAESAVNIFVDIAETADNQTYSIAATAKSDNNAEVSAPADVEIEEVVVLAETGFNLSEFLILLFALFSFAGTAIYLRKTSSDDI